MSRLVLGTGVLNWPRGERVGDRYGVVMLQTHPEQDAKWVNFCDEINSFEGEHVTLMARVLEVRDSYHIGDLFHGFSTGGAEVGEVVVLGTGDLIIEHVDFYPCVGVRPHDERKYFWLDPEILYKLHNQTVELFIKTI